MRIGLLTDGGYPYADGESRLWCDRLVRGLPQHEFDLYALSRSARQEKLGWVSLPPQVGRVRTAPLWNAPPAPRHTTDGGVPRDEPGGCLTRLVTGSGGAYGRRERRRFTAHLTALATAVSAAGAGAPVPAARTPRAPAAAGPAGAPAGADPARLFGEGLYGLAELAREHGGLPTALRSETALRVLESACLARGTGRTVQRATVTDHLAFAGELARLLMPLSLDWYTTDSLGGVDLCHAASGGTAALPGLLAKRFFGVPLLVTEHALPLRTHYLSATDTPFGAPVRALLANLHALLAAEVYRQASVVTPGNTHVRRWQRRCGADTAKLRTVYPGMDAGRFAQVGEDDSAGPDTLVWVGRVEPAKDLVALLHAFAEVHRAEPGARLRIFGAPVESPEGEAYLAHCRALAELLFPGTTSDSARRDADEPGTVESPVSFEEIGGAGADELAGAYAAGGIVVLSSVVEGFPISLVEAMFCGRATVSTDVGAVTEVIGGTGLVVPPRDTPALADACLALLRDPERRARLGEAARARALELFTVEQNLAAFRALYRELTAGHPTRPRGTDPVTAVVTAPAAARRETGGARAGGGPGTPAPRPFAVPPEEYVRPGHPRTAPAERRPAGAASGRTPAWAVTPAPAPAPEKVGAAATAGAGDGDA
ncbi:DUF3492 domain-containing protein [Streptomyces sp. NBC_00102]|uniref:DUF3492 domain-containing protein n=1 Tax=Streptomyces sp. NBC_00102 TaxID=2975652 RepID=UPI002256C539|nr:DUF3492 domain-containing protein [Streptomyces sp. NBC_00102]MCX5399585.1 DUF3492 domain-containing protein [Streptomyces sp. NBC_00102]